MSKVEVRISRDPKDCAGPPKEVQSFEVNLADLQKLLDYAKKQGWI
jgi:hypothetical protein